jgi:hypothetical protein
MEKILYLVHTTNNNPEHYTELRTATTDLDDQFPGVYFSLITTDNVDIERIYPGRYVMIFSPNLLKQKNYHINIRDYNGFITESNTYFPWNLESAIKRIEDYSKNANAKQRQNEVVFHDNIPIKYLCEILRKPKWNEGNGSKFSLPKTRCENKADPDLTKLPFYAYTMENFYTGGDALKRSSNAFFIKMARLAKLDPIPQSTNLIISAMKKIAPYLLIHRNEQNINALKNSKGGKRNTIKLSRRKNMTVKVHQTR